MVRVGEKGGNLQEVLTILAQYLKKEHDFISKVRGAMIYPAVIVSAMVIIGIIMMVAVLPKIMSMFKELKVDLPFTTKVVIAISDFMSNNFIVGVILIAALVFGLIKFLKTTRGKKIISSISIKTPLLNKFVQKMNCARFSRSFSSLMNSGVSMVESLIITSQTLDNYFYSESLIKMTEEIKKGKSLHELMQGYEKIYPVLVSQMVAIGEETGELADIINRLADFYEEEVTNITNNLTSIIEPILMIIIGAAVGFFAIAMIQPMYSMMNAL
jgi:type IV pilus assembly protein PilC